MPSPRSRPRWSSGAERSEPKPTSNRRGTSGERRAGLVADELLEVAPQALLELAPLELGHLHLDARERALQALAEERERLVELRLVDAVVAGRARQAGVEPVQRRVRDRAAQHRVDLPVDLPW